MAKNLLDKSILKKIEKKEALERREIKAEALYQSAKRGKKKCKKCTIEIVDVKRAGDRVEVFARVWDKKGKQFGFGKDFDVDIERFVFVNPPLLVPSLNGDIVVEGTDPVTKEVLNRKFKFDPRAALLEAIEQTVALKKKKSTKSKIVPNKIGNTTLTAYPDANPETTTGDGVVGQIYNEGEGVSWATIVGATGNHSEPSSSNVTGIDMLADTGTDEWRFLERTIAVFDTSSIGSDDIDSAVLSFYIHSKSDGCSTTPSANVYSAAPASDTDIADGDYDSCGTTALATSIAYASWSTSSYTDWTLNATGEAHINKSGNTAFSLRSVNDADDSAPTWSSGCRSYGNLYLAERSGTTEDPKLVVEHSAGGGAAFTPKCIIL